jgi:hypothetical protein
MKGKAEWQDPGFEEIGPEQLMEIGGGNIFTSILESGLSRAVSLIGLVDSLYELGKGFVDGAR